MSIITFEILRYCCCTKMLLYAVLLLSPFLAFHATGEESSIIDMVLRLDNHWELVFDIDNLENIGKLVREVEVVSSLSISYPDMKRALETSPFATASLEDTLFVVMSTEVKGEVSDEVKSKYESISEDNQEVTETTTRKDTYEVGPYSKLLLYRLVYTGLGLNYKTDILHTQPHEKTVNISFKVKQFSILKNIKTVYTDNSIPKPDNLINEAGGLNPDINSGFGENHVWLVPEWTTKVSEGATRIEIATENKYNPNYSDLAPEAGGTSYLYLKVLHESNSNQRITEVNLFRSTERSDDPLEQRWGFSTGNINKDREGDFLYLAYNTKQI